MSNPTEPKGPRTPVVPAPKTSSRPPGRVSAPPVVSVTSQLPRTPSSAPRSPSSAPHAPSAPPARTSKPPVVSSQPPRVASTPPAAAPENAAQPQAVSAEQLASIFETAAEPVALATQAPVVQPSAATAADVILKHTLAPQLDVATVSATLPEQPDALAAGSVPIASSGATVNTGATWTVPPEKPPGVFGPTLAIAGAVLWAYLVLGELVVNLDFPERAGAVLVLGVFGFRCFRHATANPSASWWRKGLPPVLALLLCLFALIVSAFLLGANRRSQIAAVTVMLWLCAVAVHFLGRYLSTPSRAQPPSDAAPRTPKSRWLGIALWTLCSLTTAVALLSAFDRM